MVGLDDYIFDISITANRPDCQSVLGIAREVSAILGKPLHMPAMDYKAVCDADAPVSVKVEAPDLCPRYMAHYVRNIRMGESPRWMKRHLCLLYTSRPDPHHGQPEAAHQGAHPGPRLPL